MLQHAHSPGCACCKIHSTLWGPGASGIPVVWVEGVGNRGCLLNFAPVEGRDFRHLAGAVASCLLALHLIPCTPSPGFAH